MTARIARQYRHGGFCIVLGEIVAESMVVYVCRSPKGSEITIGQNYPGVHVQPCSFCEPERIAA